ncbi:MAG: hypothetical protein ACREPM_25940 [Gemmatimonadaceae bacterium]
MRRMTQPRAITLVTTLAVLVACGPTVQTASAPVPAAHPPVTVQVPLATPPAAPAASSTSLPTKLSDADYWKLEQNISEPGGYFRIEDNYTSNEGEVGQIYTMLREAGVHGGVFIGVGPEQSFTYIAAIRPRMAFIVDIRRQAVMQHLMFKAMFELAADRADFISILFAKPRPPGIDTSTTIANIWEAYRTVKTDSALAAKNYVRVVDRLTKTHGFTFTEDENEKLKAVFYAFYAYGPAITTRGSGGGGFGGRSYDFSDLTGFATDAAGVTRSFLSSEDNYRYLKSLQERNLIVPVSGDFGGPKAIRAIGAYLTEHHGRVSAFYVSNVEQYLDGDNKLQTFYGNVATLPVDSTSVFIRPYSMRRGGMGGPTRSLCPIAAFLKAADAGMVPNNNAALACPTI